MRNVSNKKGISPLNKVLSAYPNALFSLHEGVTVGTTAAVCADSNTANNTSGNWELTVNTPADTTQWETTNGLWIGKNLNTANYAHLARTIDPTTFDSIFNIEGQASLFCAHIQRIGIPSASGRVMSVAHTGSGQPLMDIRFLTGEQVQIYYSGTGISVVTMDGTPSEVIIMFYLDDRVGGTKLLQGRAYTPGTSNLEATAASVDISAVVPNSIITDERFTVGAVRSGSSFIQLADSIRVAKVRAINFGQTPPTDLSELMDELALNNLEGTRR